MLVGRSADAVVALDKHETFVAVDGFECLAASAFFGERGDTGIAFFALGDLGGLGDFALDCLGDFTLSAFGDLALVGLGDFALTGFGDFESVGDTMALTFFLRLPFLVGVTGE